MEEAIEDVPPHKIANYDETNFTNNPGKSKIMFRWGVHYSEKIMNSSNSATSNMFIGIVTGIANEYFFLLNIKFLPEYIVYKLFFHFSYITQFNILDIWIVVGN